MLKKIAVASILGGAGVSAFAYDYSQMTNSIDWTSVTTACMTVFVAIIGVTVAIKGAKMVLHVVKGA